MSIDEVRITLRKITRLSSLIYMVTVSRVYLIKKHKLKNKKHKTKKAQ